MVSTQSSLAPHAIGYQSSAQSRSYRVLMVAPTSFFADYGCHVRILEEVQVLQKLGHRVVIATYHNGGAVPGIDIRRTFPIPWRQSYEVGSSRHKVVFDALLGLKTLELLSAGKFDLVHAHLHEGALIGMVASRLFRLPMLFDMQGSMTDEMIDHHFLRRQSPFYKPLLRLETWLDRAATTVLTSSTYTARLLVEQMGCLPARVQTLPDCVNADTFRPSSTYDPAELAALRAELGIPANRKLIVYLGLLAEYQGTGLLLEAMQRLVREGPDVHLLLMGFPNQTLYEVKAATLGIREHVTFTGRVPYQHAPIHLALGDVAVAPKMSATEGAGKLLNYMATALPVVAFDTPVSRQYLGSDGMFAAKGDVNSLAEQLRAVLSPPANCPDFYRLMGQRLRQRAIQSFSWEMAGNQIVGIYRQLLGDAPSHIISHPNLAVSGK